MEQPAGSYLLKLASWRRILQLPGIYVVFLDQCRFGAAAPDQPFRKYRKRTVLVANFCEILRLRAPCRCREAHVELAGKVKINGQYFQRSALAAAYPARLARALASTLLVSWQNSTAQ